MTKSKRLSLNSKQQFFHSSLFMRGSEICILKSINNHFCVNTRHVLYTSNFSYSRVSSFQFMITCCAVRPQRLVIHQLIIYIKIIYIICIMCIHTMYIPFYMYISCMGKCTLNVYFAVQAV